MWIQISLVLAAYVFSPRVGLLNHLIKKKLSYVEIHRYELSIIACLNIYISLQSNSSSNIIPPFSTLFVDIPSLFFSILISDKRRLIDFFIAIRKVTILLCGF